jgi:hypothetical protein
MGDAAATGRLTYSAQANGSSKKCDATTGVDGVLTFAAWGPIRGYREGLVLNSDPVITLLKSGYRPLVINNASSSDAKETDRVRGLRQDGETLALEPFQGSGEERLTDRMRHVLAEIRTMHQDS